MNRNENVVLLLDAFQAVVRSWWTIVGGLAVGVALGLLGWQYLPKTYEATTTIFVSPPQIPEMFGHSTNQDDMAIRLASLRESVLSRPYMAKLATEIYGRASAGRETELLDDLQSRLEASIIRVDERRGAGVFALSFKDPDPVAAAKVVNMLADLYIEENTRVRGTQVAGATTLLESLAGQVSTELTERDKAIAAFKATHLYELPENRETNVRMLESRQRDLENLDREIAQLGERRELLVSQRALARSVPGGDVVTATRVESPAERVLRLQSELDTLKTRYTEKHPAIRQKQEELTRAIAIAKEPQPPVESTKADTPAADPFTAQIQAADREITRLRGVRESIVAEIRLYQSRVASMPAIDQQLNQLMKGYDVLKEKLRDYQQKAESARGSQKVEEMRKGEQFEIVERATPPTKPIKPQPGVIITLGVLIGLAQFVAPVALRAFMFPRVTSKEGLKLISPYPVLTHVAQLPTPKARRQRRRQSMVNWGISAACLLILAGALTKLFVL